MDFSNFEKDHILYNADNRMKLLYFKDEFPHSNFITEYCYRTLDSE